MTERALTIPEIILLSGTRVALGLGVGLLIAGKLTGDMRRGAGWALLAVGASTSVPIFMGIFRKGQIGGPSQGRAWDAKVA